MILWLALAALALILVVSLVAAALDVRAEGAELTLGEALWSSLMRTLDPGTMGQDVGWPLRVASLTVTLGGILIVSSLIGIVANGIAQRATRLRREQSRVIAARHTLVLGWSPKVFPLVSQLFLVNSPQRSGSIVILAPLPKDEMERQVAARLPELTKDQRRALVLRTGSAYEPEHLKVARPEVADAIVVLNPGHSDGDAEVVRATLALAGTVPAPTGAVVAEIRDPFTADALESARAGTTRVMVVRAANFIARMMAQVCREPGLSAVYQDLLQFEGDEIYFSSASGVKGRTFADAVLCYENATPIGLKHDGKITLCPAMDTRISAGDEVIAIAEDREAIDASEPAPARVRSGSPVERESRGERILLIGWNELAPEIIRQLDRYVPARSSLVVHVDGEVIPKSSIELPADLQTLTTTLVVDPLSPAKLKSMMTTAAPDHVILLCYKEALTESEADSRVLLTLLHLRKAIAESGADTNIVVELLDERDAKLAEPRHNDEFIVSERLTAMLLAQYSETPDLDEVFDELLDEAGAEVYLKPTHPYAPDEPVTFADVVAGAAARGEVAIGYQIRAADGSPTVVVNPPKRDVVDLTRGRVVVLAHEED